MTISHWLYMTVILVPAKRAKPNWSGGFRKIKDYHVSADLAAAWQLIIFGITTCLVISIWSLILLHREP